MAKDCDDRRRTVDLSRSRRAERIGGDRLLRTSIAVTAQPFGVAVADLNGDGDEDLVVSSHVADNENQVSVLLGQAGAGFGPARHFAVPEGDEAPSVAVADLNGDSAPDIVTANQGAATVSVLLGRGDGGFGSKQDFTTGFVPTSLKTADLNGDGDPDLVIANAGSSEVSVLLGLPGGGHFGLKTDFAVGAGPISLELADFNGDGIQDLATANGADDDLSILMGNGDGSFSSRRDFGTGDQPISTAVGDFNQDGDTDLVVTEILDGSASVFTNTSPPVAEISPDNLSFPVTAVGSTSARQDVTVKNTGEGGLEVSSVAIEGDDADQFVISGQTCTSDSVRPGRSCTISVRFRPTVTGAASSTLRITDNAAGSPHRVGLTGGPQPTPAVSVSPASLAFGNQKTGTVSTSRRTIVTNSGTGDLIVGATTIGGGNPTQFAIAADTCGGRTILPGATCTVGVAFKPTTIGRKTAALTFAANVPGTTPSVALSGRGTGLCLPILCSSADVHAHQGSSARIR